MIYMLTIAAMERTMLKTDNLKASERGTNGIA
jgi:hypothetical protein